MSKSVRKEMQENGFSGWLMSRKYPLLLVLIIIIAFFLQVYNTSDLSGGDDSEWAELATYAIQNPSLIIYPHFPDEPIERQDLHVSRPFAIIPYMISILIFSHTKLAIVFPAAIFSVLSLVFLYLINKRLFNENVALLSCFLFSVSPFHLAFSRIGLLDASLILSCLVAFWLMIEGFEKRKVHYIYLSAFFWLINMMTTDIRGAVPVLAVLPCLFFLLLKGKIGKSLFSNRLLKHFLISYIGILVIFFLYISIPLLWGDSGWLATFVTLAKHSVGAREATEYLSFWDSVKSMGSILIFTPFLGIIFVPFLAGLVYAVKNARSFRFSFWIFYLIGIFFFYLQGQFVPQRQDIFVPAIATFAALGILVPYRYFVSRKLIYLLPAVLAASFSYLFFMLFMFSRTYPADFGSILAIARNLGVGGLLSTLIRCWWVFVLALLACFLALFWTSLRPRAFKKIKSAYFFIIVCFLLLNLIVSFVLVHTGVGVYKRTDATTLVGSYLSQNLGDEKYSCVAGVEAKSFSFYTQRTCAFWVNVNTSWLDEQVKKGNLKYFVLNTHHEYKTPGFGNVLPDGTLGPEIGNSSPWLQNHYDKYDWLHANAEDITQEVGLKGGKEFRVYQLKEGSQT